MILFFLGYYFNHAPALIPTGFIQDDNVGYVAYAHQYLDDKNFHLFYSNPFNDSANYPHIYFQTQNFILLLFLKIGIPLVLLLPFFTLLCSFFCFRIIIAIYDLVAPSSQHRLLSILLFAWGGGLLVLFGIPAQQIHPLQGLDFLDRIFLLDPAWGWWGLSFGRSLFFSCEAYYHLLFLLCIYTILRQKWLLSFFIAFILSFSHPFTGLEFLSICCAWLVIEKVIVRNRNIPLLFSIGIFLLLAIHLFYYLYYLNQFPDHKAVSQQYSLNWRLRFYSMIPAYALVAILACISIFGKKKIFFEHSYNRLFAAWFLVAFALANHELFIQPPMQPIHFTRGYIWSALFLIGIPGLHIIYKKIAPKRSRIWLLGLLACLFLTDNFLWVINNVRFPDNVPSAMHITKEQNQVLHLLQQKTNENTLIIGSDFLPYLATVYTPAYPWISHAFTTPFYEQKRLVYNKFILDGTIDTAWRHRQIVFIFRKADSLEMQRAKALPPRSILLQDSKSYMVYTTEIE